MPKVFAPKGELTNESESANLATQVDQLSDKITGQATQAASEVQPPPVPSKPAPSRKAQPKASAAPTNGCPFREAKKEKRLKLLIWGDTGTGKTVLSLRFPAPAVIDMERGTEPYAGKFRFKSLPTTDANTAMDGVKWLLTNKHSYKTLVVDPITVYWDALQKKWSDIFMTRKKDTKGFKHEFFEFQPKDWMVIKSEWKEFVRFLTALDMNVIVTARQKTQYADGGFMQKIGDTFDAERTLPYLFDVIVRLFRKDGKYMAEVVKDRFQVLPKEPFPADYSVFESAFGAKELEREANPFALTTVEQAARLRQLAAEYGMSDDLLASRVQSYGAAYGAETIEELKEEDAANIIRKLEAALAARNKSQAQVQQAAQATETAKE